MKIPVLRGMIDRRILVNYQVDPAALASVLPDPLRPKLVRGVGIGGICLIRLADVRPRLVPAGFGMGSENAAHRIAVALPDGRDGVFIPRRDTSSMLFSLVGGRAFPGRHHHSHFEVRETQATYSVVLTDEQRRRLLSVKASAATALPATSIFGSLDEASSFFATGSIGYSTTDDPARLDGLELRTRTWTVEALAVEAAYSSYFEDPAIFPAGSTRLDCALLMRDIEHEWHARESLACAAPVCAA